MDDLTKEKFFVFRNYTVEHLFHNLNYSFSEYGSINDINSKFKNFIWFYQLEPKFNLNKIQNQLESYIDLLKFIQEKLPIRNMILMPIVYKTDFTIIKKESLKIHSYVIEYNRFLLDLASRNKNIYYLNLDSFYSNHNQNLFDFKYFLLSKSIISPRFSLKFKDWFLNNLGDLFFDLKYKCIALDLDNTLWEGILGEDGSENIRYNGNFPGNLFQFFQKYLKYLSERGIILTIVSKNNFDDVKDFWENRDDLVLKWDDFSEFEINWKNKADNLISISKKLNIGLDSIIFIDDNQSEIELVRKFIPEVKTFKFSSNPEEVLNLINKLNILLKRHEVTNEDFKRKKYYSIDKIREKNKSKFNDINDFIKSLNIKIHVSKINSLNYDRIFQLVNKTNQFNLTTLRYNPSEFSELVGLNEIFSINVEDKFGDYGLTGVCIIEPHNKFIHIKNILLSCRILGKNIEHDFLNFILNFYSTNSYQYATGKFLKSKKNIQTKDFYKQNSFKTVKETENYSEFKLDLKKFKKSFFNQVIFYEKN